MNRGLCQRQIFVIGAALAACRNADHSEYCVTPAAAPSQTVDGLGWLACGTDANVLETVPGIN